MGRARRSAARLALLAPVLASAAPAIPNYHGCTSEVAKKLPYCDTSLSVDQRLDDLLSRLTLAEKVQQITPQKDLGDLCTCITAGKAEIGLPDWLWLVETNTNVASACPAEGHCSTVFVGPMGLGATFNRTVWRQKGGVLGTEMRAFSNAHIGRFRMDGKNLIGLTGYGPNINIARDPRFGRTSELPGEDPFLSGTYAFEMVSGMQARDSKGYPKMAAYLKHFTAYSTENNRGHDTYNISVFDFFDTYLPQYERAYAAKPYGVMCSYNAENGKPSCANDWLLNKVLRSWSPGTMVSTDCGAVSNLRGAPVNAEDDVHAAAYALMNGTDLEMGTDLFSLIPDAIKQGLATEARVDEAVRRAFRVHFEVGRFDPPEATEWANLGLQDVNSTYSQQVSYEAALQSLVLLKNDGALPLKQGLKVAVVGPQGVARAGLLSDYAADEMCFGGGYDCIPSIAEGIAAANARGKTESLMGVEVNSNKTDGIAPALALAKAADVVVLALGIDKSIEEEGLDRTDTALPGLQEAFALQILALDKPTILVLTNGGPLAIDNLVSRETSAPYAIIEAFNPAKMGGKALGASLFGLENRWGKLPVTMYPHAYIREQSMTNYDMSAAPGRTYKYYQGKPLFPFGMGLSLTTFEFDCQAAADPPLLFQCLVQNTGTMAGDEVIQVYHRADDIGQVDHPLPKRALVEFERIHLKAGKSGYANFQFTPDVLKVVNAQGERVLYPGTHLLIFSRGHGEEKTIAVKVPSVPSEPLQYERVLVI